MPTPNREHNRRISTAVPLALAITLPTLAACGPDTGADGPAGMDGPAMFVERLGTDTVALERYRRTADGFTGEFVVRSPVTRIGSYRATLGPDGVVTRFEVEWRTPPENPEGPEPVEATVTVEGDSATLERRGGRSPDTVRLAVPRGVIPLTGKVPRALGVVEQAVRQAFAAGGDSVPVYFLTPGRGEVTPNAIVRHGPDTVRLDFFGSPMLYHTDGDGRVLGRSGEQTTLSVRAERVTSLDIGALAADFAARDARDEGMGIASPGATVEARAGGANIEVVYSRPAKRGREIWGGLVPYGEVWRTGANAATAFSTDRDLEMGGVEVSAGDYTLYSIYSTDSAKLIINRQTGQWGTVYDASRDLARIEMQRETLGEPVERFTIDVEPRPDGGVLQLAWDRTRFSVPFTVE